MKQLDEICLFSCFRARAVLRRKREGGFDLIIYLYLLSLRTATDNYVIIQIAPCDIEPMTENIQ